MRVDIYSDMVCPFCYIGKVRFETALEKFSGQSDVKVSYRSFQLDPNSPKETDLSLDEALAKKYQMSVDKAREMNASISEQAKEVGLEFNLDRARPANTENAHRLSHYAKEQGKMEAFVNRTLKAYFTEGKNINDQDVLLELAGDVDLDKEESLQVLESNRFKDTVIAEQQTASQIGAQGVPFFVFNDKYGVSGAQPSETFLEVLQKVHEEENQESKIQVLGSKTEFCDDDSCNM
ncbi:MULTISPECIES: DsbA family protein [Allobacillus]|uniref:DsbA family oxidoreductase n=1 Tax=Allobacillus salarius TaxID=1955272 RepID=A0A556PL10_9BACI|nr:DsbA family oxidoreductase [Allobacillus salarius]TSJ65073.1 DsbA family oxidoreductase [Allobacillus salarius]